MNFELFHFLRPLWWWALLPLGILCVMAWRKNSDAKAWRKICDASLMDALLLDPKSKSRRWPLLMLALAWVATVAALAGPTWDRLPIPVFHGNNATVFVVNLGESMNAADVSPSRIGRARFELQDAIQKSAGQQIGLVIFSDEPYVVTPLADDPRVVEEVVPILECSLMPGQGKRVDRALDMATDLLKQAKVSQGRILLLTDSAGDKPKMSLTAAQKVKDSGYSLSVLGFGTAEGAPIPTPNKRGFRNDPQGKPIMDKVIEHDLADLAKAGGGEFSFTTADDSDLDKLLTEFTSSATDLAEEKLALAGFDTWDDAGAWLILLPLALAMLAFRKGWNGNAAAMLLVLAPMQVPELPDPNWQQKMFQTNDQLASKSFANGEFEKAAGQFKSKEWSAAALYKAGKYEEAGNAFANLEGVEANYNHGNALARSGKFEDAIAAYDEALKADPKHEDALFNRDLIQKLLDEQQEEEQEQQSQDGEGEEEQEGEQEQGDEQDGEQENQDQQEQQDGDESDAEQGNENQEDDEQEPQSAEKEDENSDEEQPPEDQQQVDPAEEPEVTEKDQATEQWLNRIPQDPGGLLREKLRRRHARKRFNRRR